MIKLLLFVFLCGSYGQAQVTRDDFEKIVESFHKEYDAELKSKGERIEVNPAANPSLIDFWWNLDQVHASYAGYYDMDQHIFIHYLYLLGGYARIQGMSRDGLIATLCHELGHGISGAPYKYNAQEKTLVSVEGQADYFAYRYCVPRIFKRLAPVVPIKPVSEITDHLCKTLPDESYTNCTRSFQTLESERLFFSLDPKDPNTAYDTPDLSVVKFLNTDPYYYPSSQCRLDTMMNGVLGKERPACWFVEWELAPQPAAGR